MPLGKSLLAFSVPDFLPQPLPPHEGPWEESVPYNQSTKQPTERYHEDIILSVPSIYREALDDN